MIKLRMSKQEQEMVLEILLTIEKLGISSKLDNYILDYGHLPVARKNQIPVVPRKINKVRLAVKRMLGEY